MSNQKFCTVCGAKMDGDEHFCSGCGAAVPADAVIVVPEPVDKKPPKRRSLRGSASSKILAIICAALALCLVIVLLCGIPAKKNFSSESAAIKFYSRMLRRQQLDRALLAFATEEKSDNFDYGKYLEATAVYNPLSQPLPANSPLNEALNDVFFKTQSVREIKTFCLSLLLPAPLHDIAAGSAEDYGYTYEQMSSLLNSSSLSSLRLVRCDPALRSDTSERYQQYLSTLNAAYGAAERAEYYALYSFNGRYYMARFTLLKYSAGWKIDSLGGPDSSAWLKETTKTEYLALAGK